MNTTNTIFVNGREYTSEELETLIKEHTLMYRFIKQEHERINGGKA